MAYAISLKQRLQKKTTKVDGCWLWTGSTNRHGYGRLYVRRLEGGYTDSASLAHRVSYEIYKRKIPTNLVLDHLCRNRACINPDHLEPVTLKENLHRGETLNALNRAKTHCKAGHQFSDKQSSWYQVRGFRRCAICHNEREKARQKASRRLVAV